MNFSSRNSPFFRAEFAEHTLGTSFCGYERTLNKGLLPLLAYDTHTRTQAKGFFHLDSLQLFVLPVPETLLRQVTAETPSQ